MQEKLNQIEEIENVVNNVRESHIYVLSQYAETLSKSDMLDPEPML